MFEVASRSTITGELLDVVQVADASWSRFLSAGGDGSIPVPLLGTYSAAQMETLFGEWASMIEVSYNGRSLFAGISQGMSYSMRQRRRVIRLRDVWSVLAARYAVDRTQPNAMVWSTVVSGASLRLLAKRAVQRGVTDPADPGAALPIRLEADSSGSLSRTYYGYNLEYVADVLDDLAAEGLDIDFEPTRTSGGFELVMRTGVPLVGAQHDLFVGAPRGGAMDFESTRDGALMATNSVQVGEGAEQDTLARSHRVIGSGLPTLDRTTSRKNISDPGQLSALAVQAVADHRFPTVQWDLTVPIEIAYEYRIGDTIRMHFDGDPEIPDGFHTRRIVSTSGSITTAGVRIGLQEVP